MVVRNLMMKTGYLSKFQIWHEANKEERKAKMRLYYYQNKKNWDGYRTRFKKKRRKTKGQKRFREARAKCIYYLIRVKGKSYRQVCDRLSFDDPKSVWNILTRYERKLNGKAKES